MRREPFGWGTRPRRNQAAAVALAGPGRIADPDRASAISRGTERLVFRGEVPQSEWRRMRCPFQEGDSPPPSNTATPPSASSRMVPPRFGRRVFCLHPHQDRFIVPEDAVLAIPDEVPNRRATLAANMETAINGLWDECPVRETGLR